MMKNNIVRKSLIGLGVLLVLIQFIRPSKNEGPALTDHDIRSVVPVSDSVFAILQTSCYDCHSNQTTYPWYTNIQPVGFWLNDHVNDGKRHLNFSEYGAYKFKRQVHKLEEIGEEVGEHEMPLSSYTLIHTQAKLSAEQTAMVQKWAKESMSILKDNAPANADADVEKEKEKE